MGSTVDNICANIDCKFNSLSEIFTIYDKYELEADDATMVKSCLQKLSDIKDMYLAATIEILNAYYLAEDDAASKDLHNKFVKAFHACNVVGRLDRLYTVFQKLKKIYKLSEDKLVTCAKSYEIAAIDETFENCSSDMCENCHTYYHIEEKTAEYVCKTCGHLVKLNGVVFEDEQFFYQEGQRTKHGKYDPIKHAKFWLERIQARENTEIPEAVINAVKRCIRRDELWIDKVSCQTVRQYLKQLKLTKYNNYVPLIRKTITGIEPAQLTEREVRLVYMYFGIVIQNFTKVKKDDKSNCPYHPFFIYKIIEQILNSNKDAKRRRDILSCIHLQSRETLIENDKVWFSICEHIPEFTKIATDGTG